MSEPANDDPSDELVFECDLDVAPEKVWRALSTPELRDAWLGQPEAGPCEVAGGEPGSRLDLVWPTREGDSLVSFEVGPADGGGAHLVIVHRAPARMLAFRPRARTTTTSGWRMAA